MSTGRKHREYLYRAHLMGGSTTVDAAPSAVILADLAERMSYTAIGKALGTGHSYVGKIIRGDIKRISPQRAAEIRAIANHQPADTSHVNPRPAMLHLRALHALGYTWARLATEIDGYSLGALKRLAAGGVPAMEATHAAAVHDAYQRLSMTLPQARDQYEQSAITDARNRARRNGWQPPLALEHIPDTDDTDDVDPVLVDRILAGDMSLAPVATVAERREVVRRWRRSERSLNELDRLTGWQARRYMSREVA